MSNTNGVNGHGTTNGVASHPGADAAPAAPSSATGDTTSSAIEYYILCPQRSTDLPGLITHLISRDICEKRQSEHYHKCPNCVRSRIWRERNGLPVEAASAAAAH